MNKTFRELNLPDCFVNLYASRRLLLLLGGVCLGTLTAAAQTEPLHPILTISGSGSGASAVMNIAESAYTNNFIPHSPPRNDAQGFAPAVVAGDTSWSWSSSTPNQITSKPSGVIFPNTNTALYPVRTQAVAVFLTTATNNLTRMVNAVYYNKAGSTTAKSMVFNLIDYHKLNQLRSDLNQLAPAYLNSGSGPAARDDNYARRIAIALLDWGRWHPSYYLTAINSPSYLEVTPNYLASTGGFGPQRASDHNGLAHEWQEDELKAFDAIYSSVGLANLNAEFGFDVRQYICDNLFFDEGDFLVNHIPVDIAIQSNLSGPYAVLPEVARVLNRPDYILWMDAYLDATVRQKIRRDGALEEGEGYSIGYLNANQDAAQNTHDYFLSRGATNSLLLAISNRATIYNNTFTYGQSQWSTVSLPSGQLPSFGDTPYNTYCSSHSAGYSAVLPAYGTLALGAGSGSLAVQVNQNFTGDNNHMRADMTAFVLWAFNNPYLDNIRYYNGSLGRNFGEQMLAYNTVTIDRANLTPYADADTYGNGDLTLYEAGNNGLALTEIDGQRAYSGKASRYQRLLLLNSVELAKPYVVDVFRVTGGTTHDYTFHGVILWNQNAQTSFPLVTNPQIYPMLEGSETWNPTDDTPYYGFWRNVSSNAAPGDFQITYSDTSSSHRDTRLWMTADPNSYQVYLGTTPVPARDNTVPTNFFNYLGLTRPSAIIRHRIASGTLEDLFVSVVEPFNSGVSNIVSVARLPMAGPATESAGLKITFKDGRMDTYLVNLRNPQIAGATGGAGTVATADGQYALTGRVGLQVDRPGGDSRAWTMNATDFKYPGGELITATNTYFSGLIAGETRRLHGESYDAFTTTSPLPPGTALRNQWLSLTHGALSGTGTTGISEMFRIDQVIYTNGLYHICFTNDHYLEITNGVTSVEQVAPLRTFTTSNSFEIALSAYAQQISPLPDLSFGPNGSSGPISFNFGNLGGASGGSLQVLATSSNPALVPDSNLVLGGSGTSRTITVTPAAGQTGAALITIAVTDGVWTNSRSFNLRVSDFAMTTSPVSQAVLAGNAVSYSAVVMATNGFEAVVTFGVSGAPAQASATFASPTLTGAGTNILSITTASNTPPGNYTLTLLATSGGLASTNLVTLMVTNVVALPGTMVWLGGSSWSTPLNWTNVTSGGNGPPGAANDVWFIDSGAVATTNTVNNTLDTDTTIKSLTYANTNKFHTTRIAANRTLTISGATGLLVGTETDNGTTQAVKVTITGQSGSTLAMTGGDLTIRQGTANNGSQRATLDLSAVDTFSAALNRVVIGSEGANARPVGTLYLAKTNLLTVSGTSPAIAIGGNGGGSGNAGSASQLYLGNMNQIFAASLTVGRVKQSSSTMAFNPALTNANPFLGPLAIFRSTDGVSRVPSWTMADSGASGGTVNTGGAADFSGGMINAQVSTLTLGKSSTGSGAGNPTGTFTFNAGTVDVNTLQVGYQASSTANGGANYATGIMNVNGGTLVVNSVLQLALTSGGSGATSTVGVLNLNGGTVLANTITNGGGIATINLNSGTLDLQPGGAAAPGKLFNLTTLNIGVANETDPALLTNAAAITTSAITTIASNGVLAGSTVITSARLVVSGSLALGANGPGWLTNSGPITFGAGGVYRWKISDATGLAATHWDFVKAGASIDVQSSGTNPFKIQVLSSAPADLPHFDNATSFSWPIAAGTGITNFALNKLAVDSAPFPDDLAGGYFSASTNGGSLVLTYIPNRPPVASDVTFYSSSGVLRVPISALAAHWSDPDGDAVQWVGVNTNSANAVNNVTSDGAYVYYTNALTGADTITYTIADLRTDGPGAYRPGDTVQTGVGLIQIVPQPNIGGISVAGGNMVLSGSQGQRGSSYYVLESTNVALPRSNWTVVASNVFDGDGNFVVTNAVSTNAPQRFYLLQLP